MPRYATEQELIKLEESLRLFDSYYNVFMTSDLLDPLLKSIEPPALGANTEFRQLVGYVGASWARIATAVELRFDLADAYSVFQASEHHASEVLKRIRQGAQHESDANFPAHMVARWNDGAAKLMYFSGDHYLAKQYWTKSLDIIGNCEGIGFIYPDIKSSSLRNEFEAKRISETEAGNLTVTEDERVQRFNKELEDAINDFPGTDLKSWIENDNTHSIRDLNADLSCKKRELLRGIANLYQNSGQFRQVRTIATAMQDQVRLMQSFHAEAISIYNRFKNDPVGVNEDEIELAKYRWRLVRDNGAWPRGVFFARQNLARIEADWIETRDRDKNRHLHLVSCLHELFQLIDDIQARDEALSAGEEFGLSDIELHGWTVKATHGFYEKLKQRSDPQAQAAVPKIKKWFLQELEQMVRSHRQVIKIATFKSRYAEYYDWAYKILYEASVEDYRQSRNEIDLKRCVAWAEESNCRDLLDLVASQSSSSSLEPTLGRAPYIGESNAIPPNENRELLEVGNADESVRDAVRLRASDYSNNEQLVSSVQKSYEAFERSASVKPVQPQNIDDSIYERAKQDAKSRKCYFVRFAERQSQAAKDQDRKAQYHFDAYVFGPDGSCTLLELNSGALSEVLRNLASLLNLDSAKASDFGDPLLTLAESIGVLLSPLEVAHSKIPIYFLPTGKLWSIPFHIATSEEGVLCLQRRVYIAGSLASLLTHDRISVANRIARVHGEVYVAGSFESSQASNVFGSLVVNNCRERGWSVSTNLHGNNIADSNLYAGEFNDTELIRAIEASPDVLYFGCHGCFIEDKKRGDEPLLHFTFQESNGSFREAYLTPYDFAYAGPMRDNVVTIFAACMSGQGGERAGGEVSGFYRGAIASGAGAVLLSYWPVGSVVDNHTCQILKGLKQGLSIDSAFGKTVQQFEEKYPELKLADKLLLLCPFSFFV